MHSPPTTVLDLRDVATGSGVLVTENLSQPPQPDGIFFRGEVSLPAFAKACYYAPFQKHAIRPSLDLWPEGYNQCHALPMASLIGAKRGGIFLILQLANGGYLALLPMVTPRSMGWFRGGSEAFYLEVGHWGLGGWEGELPLLAWSRNSNVYRACEEAWRAALGHPLLADSARMRNEKEYPEPFRYLGWCSWEEFKWDIDENVLREIFEKIDHSPIPIRWVLIDDGHIDEGPSGSPLTRTPEDGEVPAEESERRLYSFATNAKRFPRGWRALLDRAKQTKLRWIGIWLNFNGYWGGIHPDNALGELNKYLAPVEGGALQPRPDAESAREFYRAFIKAQREAGFDFVKVDNQAKNVTFYQGVVPSAVEATMNNHAALEEAVAEEMETMISCMAHNNLCVFSARHSEIIRCSEDYKKGDLWRAKHHLNNSFANMLWLGQTVWGDHDMFHSSDRTCSSVMARSKAISGGPIYLSDHPLDADASLIPSLCFADGALLQPLAPAVPLPESIFIDTYEDAQAYRVIAPLANRSAAVAIYNLTHPEVPVMGFLRADDYQWAGGMLQEGERQWTLPGEGLLAYDVSRKQIHQLDKKPLEFVIPAFGDELFILSPIRNGWGLIGWADKYITPAGIEIAAISEEELTLVLTESIPILIWNASGHPEVSAHFDLQDLGDSLYLVSPVAPKSEAPISLSIRRDLAARAPAQGHGVL